MKRELDDSWIGKPVVLRNGAVVRVRSNNEPGAGPWKFRLFAYNSRSCDVGGTVDWRGKYWESSDIDSDLDIDWGRTERITEHLLGLLAELHPVEKWNLGPFCDSVGIGVDSLEVKS